MLSIYQSSIYHLHHHHLSNYCGKILSKGNLGIPIKSEVNGHLKPRYLIYEKKMILIISHTLEACLFVFSFYVLIQNNSRFFSLKI